MEKRNGKLGAFFSKRGRLAVVILAVGLAAVLAVGIWAPGSGESGGDHLADADQTEMQEAFDVFADRVFASHVQTDTLTMHYKVADPAAYGLDDSAVSWGAISGQALRDGLEAEKQEYETLQSFDYSQLTGEQQLTYDVLNAYMEQDMKLEGMELYQEVLGEYGGIQAQLPVLLSEYAFYTQEDVEEYLELCRQIPSYFQQIIAFEKEKADAGLFMSDSNVDGVLEQCAAFIENPEENVLIETFPEHLDQLSGISEEQRAQWTAENEAAVKEAVIPAYELLIQELTALKGRGMEGSPADLPMGKEYYEVRAQMAVGSSKTVEEMKTMIAEALLEQMAQMEELTENNPAITARVSASAYPSGTWEALLNDLKSRIISDFPVLGEVSYEVNTVHPSLQEHLNPAFYLIPPLDRAKENVIYINESPEYDQSDLYLTLAHEGFPGHLYQNVYFAEKQMEPVRYVLGFPGYSEGWATYVENLAYDYMDTMEEEEREFLRANSFASLGLYAQMDIGVNYDGWSLEKLKDFIELYFDVSDETVIQDIYDMMTNDPANYLSYFVGCLEFGELREKAQQVWGDGFSPLEFHKRILDIGPAPFDVVEKYLL